MEPDPGLSDLGLVQAQAVARRLMALPNAERPTAVISSPLRRCRKTAAPLAEALGVSVLIDPSVGEIPTPAGLSVEQRPGWLQSALAGRWADIRGDLDYGQWRADVIAGVAARPGAAVFSHFVAINALVSQLLGRDDVLVFRPNHCSVTVVKQGERGLELVSRGEEAATGVL